jgi:outer membrane protein assembly factor BamD
MWIVRGLACALLLALGGCELETPKSAASLTYTEDAFKAYREAMDAFEDRNWTDARALFGEVRKLFGFSRFARLAELRIADIDFEQGKYSEAVAGYRSFVRGHADDDNAEYAKYRICKSLYLDLSDTVLLPPAEERDQGGTEDAWRELRAFNGRYPHGRYRVDARYLLEVVTQRLVRHELYVARYYLREDRFAAVLRRIDYALATYPGSGLDAEALVLKGETLLKSHQRDQARAVFEQVIAAHGGPFGVVAKRFLAQLPPAGAPAGEAGLF